MSLLTFYVTSINLLLTKHKLTNFDRIVNNLIVKLSELNERVDKEAAAAVLKNQKQLLVNVLGNRCS